MPARSLFVMLAVALFCATGLVHAAGTASASSAAPKQTPTAKAQRYARKTDASILVSQRGRRYRILVSVPQAAAPAGGYPVIFVLDGDGWFGAAVEIARMREYEKLDPALIVGVGYPSRAFFDAAARSYDFTPPGATDPDFDGVRLGGADEFLTFLDATLKPWLQRRYKIDRGRQILFGHSLGGLFALHVLFKTPQSFNVYIIASPHIHFSNDVVLKDESSFEAGDARHDVRILLSDGGLESQPSPELVSDYRRWYTAHPQAHPGQTVEEAINDLFATPPVGRDKVADTRALVARLVDHGVNATFVEFPGEEHMSAAIAALNRGIPFALRPPP